MDIRGLARAMAVLFAGVLAAAFLPATAGSAAVAPPGLAPSTRLALPITAVSFTWLSGVFCTSGSNCWAVGTRQASAKAPSLNQVLRWNGATWRPVPVPQPGGQRHDDFADLATVRCLTARDCWAVGEYLKNGAYLDEALRWNGAKWSQVATPAPGGTLGGDASELNDVVCTAAANCWAVGDYGPQSGITAANQALHWNGKKWSVSPMPNPAGTNTGDTNIAGSVRCTSPTACLVVGYETPASSPGTTLNESLRWNGKKWLALKILDPISGTDDAVNDLAGLACSSSVSCWAVGSEGTSGTVTTLLNQILHWNGTKWLEVQPPDPDGTSTGDNNVLLWDTCVSGRDCWAVGTYGPDSGATTNLKNEALRWNGATWSRVKTPNPGNTANQGISALLGIRCTSGANCWAVGFQDDCGSLADQILHWNGKKWTDAGRAIDAIRPACPERSAG